VSKHVTQKTAAKYKDLSEIKKDTFGGLS